MSHDEAKYQELLEAARRWRDHWQGNHDKASKRLEAAVRAFDEPKWRAIGDHGITSSEGDTDDGCSFNSIRLRDRVLRLLLADEAGK